MTVLGVLITTQPKAPPGSPSELPLGRAARILASEGIDVVFGERAEDGVLHGHRAIGDAWEPGEARVDAVYDRFQSQTHASRHHRALEGLADVPVANPPAIVALCRDKVRSQRVLEEAGIRMPPLVEDPADFSAALRDWGSAFAKPRYGSFGRGVRHVEPGDRIAVERIGALEGVVEPTVLQRAVPPPPGWAGVSVRVLVQREAGGWSLGVPVARRSPTDPVVNVDRGAEAVPAEDALDARIFGEVRDAAAAAARVLAAQPDGDWLAEVGVDVVLDPSGRPWVIEVNGRPRGRLARLAARDPGRFEAAWAATVERPLRWLAGAAKPR